MDKDKIYEELVEQSTWRLFWLSFITFGIYFVHYIARQTDKLNIYLDDCQKISKSFISFLILFMYIGSIATLFSIFFENKLFEGLENNFSLVSTIFLIIWGFKARNRINKLMNYTRRDNNWFNAFWTFFLTPLYFNYKINCIWNEILINSESKNKISEE